MWLGWLALLVREDAQAVSRMQSHDLMTPDPAELGDDGGAWAIGGRALLAFIEVADSGSFRLAADRMQIAQSVVTRHVQRLEAILDVRLFERSTRSVMLTTAGEQILPHARVVVASMVNLVDQAALARETALRGLHGALPDDRGHWPS